MANRIDKASRVIHASEETIYGAFADAQALENWLPPRGMTGCMLAFDFREGGLYRIRLSYNEPQHIPGKTSEHADEVTVRFVRLVTNQCIEQAVSFESENPEYSAEMKITWAFNEVEDGTLVAVRCENVPDGIRPEDHEAGLVSSLENLARFVERGK
jgi:uncharacterized protein YndB with AHSA1/START domain